MKKLLLLGLMLLGLGGVISVQAVVRLNATFSTPAGNGAWDAGTNTYTWTGSTNNLMTIFNFPNGELTNYTKIHLEVAQETHHNFRICLMKGTDALGTVTCWSSGTKDIIFADHTDTKNVDLSQVTHIAFGGAVDPGQGNSYSCVLTNVYLEGPDPVTRDVYQLGSPITFEQALASTDPFVLVQDGKVLCGPLSPSDASLTFKDVSEINNYSWTFKFEEDAANEGSYFMELYNAKGTSKGYINASVWSHTYLSGVDKNGTKGEQQDGALWTITATNNGKYTIKNLGVTEGNYNNKPNGNEGDRAGQGQGFLAITPDGYWANHVTIYNTSGEWEFYTLNVVQLPTNDPVYFGWEDFNIDDGATKDDENHLVIDTRDYAPYWATSGSWKFATPFDASNYRYLVFYAKRNISKYGNADNDTGGSLFITDDKGVTMRQDDYSKYNDVNYPDAPSGSFWMNKWGDQRAMALDLQWLANTDKYGDGESECKAIDVSKIKQVGVAGTFTIGGIFFTNTLPACSAGDYKRTFTNEENPVYGNFGTICLPYSAVCTGAQLYQIVGKTANAIMLAEHEGVMEAGKPYLYKTLEAKQCYWGSVRPETAVYFFKAGYEQVEAPVENNGLIGTFTEINSESANIAASNFFVLSGNQIWDLEGCTGDDKVTIGANKAYIDTNKITNQTAGSRTILLSFDGAEEKDPTAIESTEAVEVLTDGVFYDMSGREVSNLTPGIYIVKYGNVTKKVMIK